MVRYRGSPVTDSMSPLPAMYAMVASRKQAPTRTPVRRSERSPAGAWSAVRSPGTVTVPSTAHLRCWTYIVSRVTYGVRLVKTSPGGADGPTRYGPGTPDTTEPGTRAGCRRRPRRRERDRVAHHAQARRGGR